MDTTTNREADSQTLIQQQFVDLADTRRVPEPLSDGAGAGGGHLRAAEFFAGIGLVRCGLAQAGIDVVWANDIEPVKESVYAANFDASDYVLGDVRDVSGGSLPSVHVATASFPCVDLSLAGHRRGLAGEQSGLFFEFTRVLNEMGPCGPSVVMIENVTSFLSSRGGRDLCAAIAELNSLGYVCDLLAVDARWFTPQSRPRLFIVGTGGRVAQADTEMPGPLHPMPVASFLRAHRDLMLQQLPVPVPRRSTRRFRQVVERLDPDDDRWWDAERLARFLSSLPARHRHRLDSLQQSGTAEWRTAYRRTRGGLPVWEIRSDEIAGCLRTARGGSSRQAVVEAACDGVRVRWMTPREYARLQGVPEDFDLSSVTQSQALYGLGDAVCVPAIAWLAQHVLIPAVSALAARGEAA